MRVFLLDDHELFREGLKLLLAQLEPDIEFLEASSFARFSTATSQAGAHADMLLLDLGLPDINGLKALRAARELLPKAVIVVLSSEDDPRIILAAIHDGAAGFIPKSSTKDMLIAALKLVLAGGVYIPTHALAMSAASPMPKPSTGDGSDPLTHLTTRQRAVLELAVQGKVNKIIARELDISEATVKAHLSVCFRVLGVKNRTEAVFRFANAGYMPFSD